MPYKDPEKQKLAQARYYQENKTRLRLEQKNQRSKLRRLIEELKSVPCTDCGILYPTYIMDFDHCRGTKSFTISVHLSTKNPTESTLRAEIAKCDVVCANCHRHRTWMRQTGKPIKIVGE
jgi:hypothetical protein